MELSSYFQTWSKLTARQQDSLLRSAFRRSALKGTLLYTGAEGCTGLLVVISGQLRVYALSPEGREVTLYRLFDRDVCLFSASCMISSLQLDLAVEAEKDTDMWVIPAEAYQQVMAESAALANYTSQLMASRFSDVMWLMEQIMWKSQDKRLASFLLEESELEESSALQITHDRIANHLGTAREVVTRMLRYFQAEGMVGLSRGSIALIDQAKLKKLAKA